jgi:hypothetical protein
MLQHPHGQELLVPPKRSLNPWIRFKVPVHVDAEAFLMRDIHFAVVSLNEIRLLPEGLGSIPGAVSICPLI